MADENKLEHAWEETKDKARETGEDIRERADDAREDIDRRI